MVSYWKPAGTLPDQPYGKAFVAPEPGQVIGWRWDRQAYRVREVTEVDFANWDERTLAYWEKKGRPDPATWDGREQMILAETARNPQPDGKDRVGLRLLPWAYSTEQWFALDDPYPTCVDCGLLWPCPCHDRNREAEAATSELERLAAILPGCCWACGEPITGRHRSIVFDGENLLLPGAGPVVFHTSQSRKAHTGTCRGQAIAYEKRWVEAGPARRVRLRCPGYLWRHFDWTECSQGDLCPGAEADHKSYQHCTTSWRLSDGSSVRPVASCGTRGCKGGA